MSALPGLGTGLYVDGNRPPEALHPGHLGGRFVRIDAPGSPWHNALAPLEVRGEQPVKSGEVQARPGHQGRQAGDEVERFQCLRCIADVLFPANDLESQR